MIKVLHVYLIAPLTLAVDFSDRSHGLFDGRDYLTHHQGPLLEQLRDPTYFARCFIDAGALCWPNGLELSPARVYELAKVPSEA